MSRFLVFFLFVFSIEVFAQDRESVGFDDSLFSNEKKSENYGSNSVFWFPILSYVVPGTGQFINGQSGAGAIYLGTAGVGLATAMNAQKELTASSYGQVDITDLDSYDPAVRRYLWGLKTYDLAGSLSLYHSFHTTLKKRKANGEFQFLPQQTETSLDLMTAPFAVKYFTRWSTLIPLTLGLGLVVAAGANDNYHTRNLTGDDVLFSSAISYNAGVGEEALFRGWMFPLLTELYGIENVFWANVTQAALFGAAHISSENPLPIAQTLAGFYFGTLVKRNGWSLREAVFLHTWWDIIVFTASFTQGNKKASIYIPLYQTNF